MGLKESGHTVWLASHDYKDGVGSINLGHLSGFRDYFRFSKINKLVKKYNPDVVHAHVLNHYGLMAVGQAKPLVVAMWGSDVMLAPNQGNLVKRLAYKIINKLVLMRAEKCHTSGQHVAREANKLYGKSLEKINVFYWGFPLERPTKEKLIKATEKLKKDFGIETTSKYIVFPRGLALVYNPSVVAKIINSLKIKMGSLKQVVVLKGFSNNIDEIEFAKLVNINEFIYINRLLSSEELYSLYENTCVHVSVPVSDSLGGGVVEPAIFGSFPILSNIPSYLDYASKNSAYVLPTNSDEDIEKAVTVISDRIISDEVNINYCNYSKINVLEKLELLYSEAITIRAKK